MITMTELMKLAPAETKQVYNI